MVEDNIWVNEESIWAGIVAVVFVVASMFVIISAPVIVIELLDKLISVFIGHEIIPFYVGVIFGILLLSQLIALLIGVSLNPLYWYAYCFGHHIYVRRLTNDEIGEFKGWIDNNIQGKYFISLSGAYMFIRDGDALAFKIQWG